MPFAVPALKRSPAGAYAARKSIPKDVRNTYERLYGQRWETKFSLPALTRPQDAKARFAAWLAEIEERITAIRDGRASIAGAVSRCLDVRNNPLPSATAATQPAMTPWTLFEQWVAAKQPNQSTVNRWRSVFIELEKRFGGRSLSSITHDDAQAWAEGLITKKRTPRTVTDVWCSAARTVLTWAVKTRKIGWNPFEATTITQPRKVRTRETDEFTPAEVKLVLTSALAFTDALRPFDAARRWVPWLCAYTGARAGEITQLRGKDVVKQGNIWAIQITPEAGTVKTSKPRTVPLHEHLITQGFIKFARAKSDEPLFYNTTSLSKVTKVDPTNPPRPRSVKTRERLADWVRNDVGITDKAIRPNHAWRHTFKRRAARAGIDAGIRDAICGHSPRTVADIYETPTLEDMVEALKRFPRYGVASDGKKTSDEDASPSKDQQTRRLPARTKRPSAARRS